VTKKPMKVTKTAWVVEFGMLDRQRALAVVVVEGEHEPSQDQLSQAYDRIDEGWEIDKDFCTDEGTHFVYNKATTKDRKLLPVVDFTAGEFPEYTEPKNVAKTETWYTWRELKTVEGETEPRLLVPWSDPQRYEFAFDFVYRSPQEARKGLKNFGVEREDSKDWILCKMTLEPVR